MNNFSLKNRGFTLIELMITVGVVAILAAIAIPAYQDYTIRSQVTEGFSLISGVKPMVSEYHANHGVYPQNNQDLGYAGATGKYVTAVEVLPNGIITATFGGQSNAKLSGQKLYLSPTESYSVSSYNPVNNNAILASISSILGNSLSQAIAQTVDQGWVCFSSVDATYLPSSCSHVSTASLPSTQVSTPSLPTFDPNFQASYLGGYVTYNNGVLMAGGNTIPGTQNTDGFSYDVSGLGAGDAYNGLYINSSGELVLTSSNLSGVDAARATHYFKDSPDSYSEYTINAAGTAIDTIVPGYTTNIPAYITNNQTIYQAYANSVQGIISAMWSNGDVSNSVAEYQSAKTNYVNMLKTQQTNGVTLNDADLKFLASLP